jgi:hypothetical protein
MATSNRNGEADAALLAAGIGCFAMGLLTLLSEVSESIGGMLGWSSAVGALSGKSTLSVIVWLVCWFLLHMAWRGRALDDAKIAKLSYVLIGLGFLGTFPPFWHIF